MKIVYASGASGMHMPYEFSQIKTPEDFERFKEIWQPDAHGTMHYVGKDNCSIVWEPVDINYVAGNKIRSVYPEYKQLNVLRSGDSVAINKMNTFIDSVRAWANSTNPDPWDGTLDAITA